MKEPKDPLGQEFRGVTGYFPLSESLIGSSLWIEADEAMLRVWLVLISEAWKPRSKGIVRKTAVNVSFFAHVGIEETKKALDRLMAPDPNSGDMRHEGRRLEPLDPENPYSSGWKLLTWDRYAGEVKRANAAAASQKYRATKLLHPTEESDDASENVITHHQPSDGVKKRHPIPGPDPGPDPVVRKKNTRARSAPFVPPTLDEVKAYAAEKGWTDFDSEGFHAHFETRGWVPKGYTRQMTSWKSAMVTWRKNQGTFFNGKASSQAAPAIELRNGRYRLPSGWWASEDGSSIEKDFETYTRRPGSLGMRYVHESDDDGVGFYVTGASIRSCSYTESIRQKEREILKGHPRFVELFPEVKP